MTPTKEDRVPRVNPLDHPEEYRAGSLIATAARVRKDMLKKHRRDPDRFPAPVGPSGPSKIWDSDACPWSRGTIYCYLHADARRAGRCVDPRRLMELMGLPAVWANPRKKPTVPTGRADAAELQAILDAWMNPETRRIPTRKAKPSADAPVAD